MLSLPDGLSRVGNAGNAELPQKGCPGQLGSGYHWPTSSPGTGLQINPYAWSVSSTIDVKPIYENESM